MDVKKWQALLTSVSMGSFSRAAEKLGYTQSGLTYMMNSLEEEVGFKLLRRNWEGISLTAEGKSLLAAIQSLVASENDLNAQIAEISGRQRRHICIGTYASLSIHWLSPIIAPFRKTHPNVEIELRIGSREELRDWLEADAITFAFSDRIEPESYEWLPLYHDPLMVVLPPDHPAAALEVVSIKDDPTLPFLVPSPSTLGGPIESLPFIPSNDMRVVAEDDTVLISMVSRGLGVSILSELSIRGRTGNTITRPLSPARERILGINRKKGYISAVEQELIQCIKDNTPAG